MKKLILISLMTWMMAPVAMAGSLSSTKIASVLAGASNLYYVNFATAIAGPPSCVTTYNKRFVFNISTAPGKAMLSTLLMAQSSGAPVSISGNGACADAAGTESIKYVTLPTVNR
ncbi:MAG: hypothetical protein ACAH59_06390 [Pseudobdellovibrionaceae bacterium]